MPEALKNRPALLPVALAALAVLGGCGASDRAPEATPTGATAETPPPPAPVAAAPVGAPPAAFATCRACHAVEAGQNGVGPTLFGIVGSKAGAVPGYAFSPALKASGITWDRASLDTWLKGPMAMVPGTKMVIAVPDAARREAIIDYLETLK